ncbi:MAG: glycosyltransferase [Anaerolineales bacterium]|jgi:glycosyltransferase involved in cell wall biosynthesis
MQIDKADLSIIVPVYNEEQVLPSTAKQIIDFGLARGWTVIFIDDGSQDASSELLDALEQYPNVKIFHHKVNRGYGGAIKTGIRNTNTSYLVTIDADGQHNLEDIDLLYQLAKKEQADLIVGNRETIGNSNAYRTLGKQIIRAFARSLMPLPINDLNSGFKLYRTELAKKYIKICPDTMSFSDVITLVFIKKRDLVLEHSVRIQPRVAGKSTINTYTAIETILEILNIAVLFNPLRIFLPISILCILLGLIWGISILIVVGRGVSVGAMLAIVTGVIFFVLGLLANQISALRMEQLQD